MITESSSGNDRELRAPVVLGEAHTGAELGGPARGSERWGQEKDVPAQQDEGLGRMLDTASEG